MRFWIDMRQIFTFLLLFTSISLLGQAKVVLGSHILQPFFKNNIVGYYNEIHVYRPNSNDSLVFEKDKRIKKLPQMNVKLKYPVILVHGINSKDYKLFWGNIPKRLEELGLKVYFGNTDAWGSIENNAEYLKETVDKVLSECNCNKVNIIAHSKGGIDSRYLISSLNYGDKVASLTTISTPHKGAELADYIFEHKSINKTIVKNTINLFVKLFGDNTPEPYVLLSELTTKSMEEFNLNNPNDDRVVYLSYYSSMKHSYDDVSLFLTHWYLSKVAGENDGIVTVDSAKWGENHKLVEGKNRQGISHIDMVDFKRFKISGVDIPEIYIEIVKELEGRGL